MRHGPALHCLLRDGSLIETLEVEWFGVNNWTTILHAEKLDRDLTK